MRSNEAVGGAGLGLRTFAFDGVVALPVAEGAASPVAALASISPGPMLGSVLTSLGDPQTRSAWLSAGLEAPRTAAEWARAEADLALAVLQGWDRQLAAVTAQREVALAEAARLIAAAPPPDEMVPAARRRWSGREVASAEIAAALRISPRAVDGQIDRASRAASCVPGTLWLLERGHVGPGHLRALLDETVVFGDPHVPDGPAGRLLAAVEARVLARAPEQTPAEFRRSVRRAVARVDPAGEARRHEEARVVRGVTRSAADDAMSVMTAFLTAPESQVVYAALDAVIAAMPPQVRTCDPREVEGASVAGLARDGQESAGQQRAGQEPAGRQRTGQEPGLPLRPVAELRVDALVAICTAVLGDQSALPGLLRAKPAAPAVNVTISAATLLGLDDEPGELAGHGPIPAEMARALAADGAWRRFVTDPLTGELLDRSPHTYAVTGLTRALVVAHDLVCVHPGCQTSAARSDIDHIDAFDHDDPAAGGLTVRSNLCARCRRHHNLKTWYSWQVSVDPDGTMVHRTALGRVYRRPPPAQPTAL